jgi:hypothetical protein
MLISASALLAHFSFNKHRHKIMIKKGIIIIMLAAGCGLSYAGILDNFTGDSMSDSEGLYIDRAVTDEQFLTEKKFNGIAKSNLMRVDEAGLNKNAYLAWAADSYRSINEKYAGGVLIRDLPITLPQAIGVPKSEEEGIFGRIFYEAMNRAIKGIDSNIEMVISKAKKDYRITLIKSGMHIDDAKKLMGKGGYCGHEEEAGKTVCNWVTPLKSYTGPYPQNFTYVHSMTVDIDGFVEDTMVYSYK